MNGIKRDIEILKGIELFDPKLHKITRKPNKIVQTKRFIDGKTFEDGSPFFEVNVEQVEVAKIPLNFVEYGIDQKCVFTVGGGVDLLPNLEESKVAESVKRNWKDVKIENELIEILRTRMAETQVAILFYNKGTTTDVNELNFNFKILSPSRGDVLEPIFDEYDDLISFKRTFQNGLLEKTYTDEYLIENGKAIKIRYDGEGNEIDRIDLGFTNIPIVYWSQDRGEFENTRAILESYENGVSTFTDSNEYFADPLLKAIGEELELPEKTSAGKVFKGGVGTDLEFIQPEGGHEMRQYEFELKERLLLMLNRVADFSFDKMANLGTLSGTALDKLLIDPQIGASLHQKGEFGKGVQRMVNWLTKEWRNIYFGAEKELRIQVRFNRFSMQDESEKIAVRMSANGNKPVETQRQSLEKLGVDNVDETLENLNPTS